MTQIGPMQAFDHVPHPLIIVTAGDPDKPERRGGMTAAWATRVSWDPPLIAVAFAPTRYTLHLIKEFGEFVVNVVGPSLKDAAFGVFGTRSGRDIDKFAATGVKVVKARSVKAPVLVDATVALECKVEKMVEAGDHVVVIARVVDAHKLKDEKPLVFLYGRAVPIQ